MEDKERELYDKIILLYESKIKLLEDELKQVTKELLDERARNLVTYIKTYPYTPNGVIKPKYPNDWIYEPSTTGQPPINFSNHTPIDNKD